MFCADNYVVDQGLFKTVEHILTSNKDLSAIYPCYYARVSGDNSLNRYFSLIGGNDPVVYYLGKNDRWPHVLNLKIESDYQPSYGCNGFFYKAEDIKTTNLDNYYPMDNAMEVQGMIATLGIPSVWHRTSDNLFTFLKKRYIYARDLYSNRANRRWKAIDTREDYWRLFCFIAFTLTVVEPLLVSIRGFRKIKDPAWFWHWPVCVGFLITYGILACRNLLRRPLSSPLSAGATAYKPALKA